MSDTPRTDKEELNFCMAPCVPINFARTLERENQQLREELKECAAALDEISTHLDPIDCALRKARANSSSEDDKSYWLHEIEAHNSNAKGVNTALSHPLVQAALKEKE